MDKPPTEDLVQKVGEGTWKTGSYSFFAGFLTLTASLANFLNHHGYSYFRAEVAISYGILAASCVLMAAIYTISTPLIRRVLEAILVTLLFDLNITGPATSLIIFFAVLAFFVILKKNIVRPMSVFGGILLVVTLTGSFNRTDWPTVRNNDLSAPSRDPQPIGGDRPAVVHILMDEHLGFGGFPETPSGTAARDQLVDHYLDRDFRIFPRVYSEHLHTINSVPDILDFGEGEALSADRNGMVLGPTRTFKEAKTLGYDLSIYQSDFGDYCTSTSTSICFEYDSEGLLPLVDAIPQADDRARLILAKFFKLSDLTDLARLGLLRFANNAFGVLLASHEPLLGSNLSSSVAALEMFEVVTERLEEMQPGQAIFFHSLFPHYPLATTDDCSVKPLEDWRLRRGDGSSMEARQASYFEQLSCAGLLVDRVVDALEKSPASGNYVLVLHGDHGSRITHQDPLANQAEYLDRDLTASFSTLMAIKISGQKGGIDNSLTPVSAVIRDLSLKEYKAFPVIKSVRNPTVTLDDREWRQIETKTISPSLFQPIDLEHY